MHFRLGQVMIMMCVITILRSRDQRPWSQGNMRAYHMAPVVMTTSCGLATRTANLLCNSIFQGL